MIHGCYRTSNPAPGALIVIDSATETCPSGTVSLNWNQEGLQGPAGPEGATGPAGSTASYIVAFPPSPAWSYILNDTSYSALSGNCDSEDIAVHMGLELQSERDVQYLQLDSWAVAPNQIRMVFWNDQTVPHGNIYMRVVTKCLDLPPLR